MTALKRALARHGELARWLIPPARDWQRKSGMVRNSQLFLPLALIYLAVALLTADALLLAEPSLLNALRLALILLLVGALVVLVRRIREQLLLPLSHLRNWAARVRGGNLAARLPTEGGREYASLATDINDLSENLETLSREMRQEVRRQTERLERQTRSLKILYDIAASLNTSRNLNDLLTRFLHTLKGVTGAYAATVRLLDKEGEMRLVASLGLNDEIVERDTLMPNSDCLCGRSVREGEIRGQTDMGACSKLMGRNYLHVQGAGMVVVPLQYGGRTLGVYNLFLDRQETQLHRDTRELLTNVGRHLGMAIEKAHLDEESKRLSIMEERTSFAHELHDSLAQTLASLRFQIRLLSGQDCTQSVEKVKDGIDQAYSELRDLITHFRVPMDAKGLVPAISRLVERFRKQSGAHVYLQHEGWDEESLPAETELQVMRVVQEALVNIEKHSQASNVRVLLSHDGDEYRVLVEDDGIGVQGPTPDGSHPGEHVGIRTMRERAQRMGGKLRIDSEAGDGTRISLSFRHSSEPASRRPPLARWWGR